VDAAPGADPHASREPGARSSSGCGGGGAAGPVPQAAQPAPDHPQQQRQHEEEDAGVAHQEQQQPDGLALLRMYSRSSVSSQGSDEGEADEQLPPPPQTLAGASPPADQAAESAGVMHGPQLPAHLQAAGGQLLALAADAQAAPQGSPGRVSSCPLGPAFASHPPLPASGCNAWGHACSPHPPRRTRSALPTPARRLPGARRHRPPPPPLSLPHRQAPAPPPEEVRGIIHKLVGFVHKNGIQFEVRRAGGRSTALLGVGVATAALARCDAIFLSTAPSLRLRLRCPPFQSRQQPGPCCC
jgi:hypothetical protein